MSYGDEGNVFHVLLSLDSLNNFLEGRLRSRGVRGRLRQDLCNNVYVLRACLGTSDYRD